MKKTVIPALKQPDELQPEHAPPEALEHDAHIKEVPSTGPMSKEARLALMRERHMGTAKVSVVEIELALSLSKKGVHKEVEDRLQQRQGHGMTTTPIDPFELQERLKDLESPPQAEGLDDQDDEVDTTRRVNTKALLEHLSQRGLEAPLTMPIELDDIVELQELARAQPALPALPGIPMTMRLDESDLERLEHPAAQSMEMPLISVEELLPETTKLDRFSFNQALRGESMTTTGEHALPGPPTPLPSQRTPVLLSVKPYLEALESSEQDTSQGSEVRPRVSKNFGAEQLGVQPAQDQLQTIRLPPSELRKLSTQATPLISMDGTLTEDTARKVKPIFTPVHQTKNPKVKGQDKLIAVTLGIVFVLVGVALGWMAIQ